MSSILYWAVSNILNIIFKKYLDYRKRNMEKNIFLKILTTRKNIKYIKQNTKRMKTKKLLEMNLRL